MSTLILIRAACLAAIGIVGCFMPVVPGPLLAYCGVLCLLFTDAPPPMTALVAFGAAIIGGWVPKGRIADAALRAVRSMR